MINIDVKVKVTIQDLNKPQEFSIKLVDSSQDTIKVFRKENDNDTVTWTLVFDDNVSNDLRKEYKIRPKPKRGFNWPLKNKRKWKERKFDGGEAKPDFATGQYRYMIRAKRKGVIEIIDPVMEIDDRRGGGGGGQGGGAPPQQ